MITVTPYVMNYEWKRKNGERQSNEKDGKNFPGLYGRITENVAYGKICEWIRNGLIAQPEYFINPEKYFWADGDYLRLLGTDLSFRLGIINRGPGDVLYPQLLTEEGKDAVEQLYGANYLLVHPNEILQAIYDYLSSIETTPYYKALMEFKWRTGLLSFPLFDIKEKIKKIDGKLVECVWDDKRSAWIPYRLLTSEVVEEEVKAERDRIRQVCECKPVGDELKKRLSKGLLASHEEELLTKEFFQAGFPWGNVEYSLPVSGQLEVHYDTSKEPFVRSKPHPKPKLSSEGRESLRQLTGGDTKLLDDIAELVARLYMPEQPSNYLWIVCSKEKRPLPQFEDAIIRPFAQWVLALVDGKVGTAAYIGDDSKRSKELACDQVRGCLLQANKDYRNSAGIKDLNLSWLRIFIKGEKVGTLDDPYQQGTQSVCGKSVLMYFTVGFNEVDFSKIPYKVIQVPRDWTAPGRSAGDSEWVQTCLLCHGLHIVQRKIAKQEENTMTKDDVIRKFVREFCEDRPDSWIERKNFCKYLAEYGKAFFPMAGIKDEPTKLGAYIQELLMWKSEGMGGMNRRLGFRNKYLDEARLDEALHQAEELRTEEEAAVDFDQYIDSFSDLIRIEK